MEHSQNKAITRPGFFFFETIHEREEGERWDWHSDPEKTDRDEQHERQCRTRDFLFVTRREKEWIVKWCRYKSVSTYLALSPFHRSFTELGRGAGTACLFFKGIFCVLWFLCPSSFVLIFYVMSVVFPYCLIFVLFFRSSDLWTKFCFLALSFLLIKNT